MSDDYDGDDGDDGDESIEETRTDMWGRPMAVVDGKELTEKTDVFGNTVYEDDNGNEVMREQPDGDVYMEETGETYTPMKDPTGLDMFHGSEGGIITGRTGMTGNVEYTIEGAGDGLSGETEDEGSHDDADRELIEGDGDDEAAGNDGNGQRGRAPVQSRQQQRRQQPAVRRQETRGRETTYVTTEVGFFFTLFFFVFEAVVVYNTVYIFWLQHVSMGMSLGSSLLGALMLLGLFYVVVALLWVTLSRPFLFFSMKRASLMAWLLTLVMLFSPAVSIAVIFAMLLAR